MDFKISRKAKQQYKKYCRLIRWLRAKKLVAIYNDVDTANGVYHVAFYRHKDKKAVHVFTVGGGAIVGVLTNGVSQRKIKNILGGQINVERI